EDLLAEIVLAVLNDGDHAQRGGLEERQRVDAGEREGEEVEAGALAKVRLERAAKHADQEDGKDERADQPRTITQELAHVAVGNGQNRIEVSHASACAPTMAR